MSNEHSMSRRRLIKSMGGIAVFGALGTLGVSRSANAAANGFGLTITEHAANGRLHYFRFATNNVGWNPAVNILLPEDYFSTQWRRYPVMYLLHGGLQDFRKFHLEDDIVGLTRGRRLIVVMPDCYLHTRRR